MFTDSSDDIISSICRYVHHVINSGIENGEQICRDIIDNIINYIRKYVVSWISSIGGWVSNDVTLISYVLAFILISPERIVMTSLN